MTKIVPKINFAAVTFLTKEENTINEVLQFIEEWNNDNDFFLNKTSGSTGKPKEIKLFKAEAFEIAKITSDLFHFTSQTVFGNCLPIASIGAKMQFIRALVNNSIILVLPPTNFPLLDVAQKIDFISFVPYQLQSIIAKDVSKLKLIGSILIGGAKMSSGLKNKLQEVQFEKCFESYGMTETYAMCAYKHYLNDRAFKPLSHVSFELKEERIELKSSLFQEIIRTNDIAKRYDDGTFELLGRADFAINSGGKKFLPEDLESKISKVIKDPFFIFGEQQEPFGEIICLHIQGNKMDENKILLELKSILEKHEVPKKIVYYANFVYTSTGKIDKLKTIKIKN